MKHPAYMWVGVILCVILVVVLLFKINSLESEVRSLSEPNAAALTTLQDTLKRVQAEAQAARDLAPGLGESMTTIHQPTMGNTGEITMA